MRANGAIEGGAAGFSTDDLVFVMKRLVNDVFIYYVIGHIEGPVACLGTVNALIQLPGDKIEVRAFEIQRNAISEEHAVKTILGFSSNDYQLCGVGWSSYCEGFILFYLMPSTSPPETYDAVAAIVDMTKTELDGSINFEGLSNVLFRGYAMLNEYGSYFLVASDVSAKKYWIRCNENYFRDALYYRINWILNLNDELDSVENPIGWSYPFVELEDPYIGSVPEMPRHADGLIRLSNGTNLWWENDFSINHAPVTIKIYLKQWWYSRTTEIYYGVQVEGGGIVETGSNTDSYSGMYIPPYGGPYPTAPYTTSGLDFDWYQIWDGTYIKAYTTLSVYQVPQYTVECPEGWYYSTTWGHVSRTSFRYSNDAATLVIEKAFPDVFTGRDFEDPPENATCEITSVVECGEKLCYGFKRYAGTSYSFELRLCADKLDPMIYTVLYATNNDVVSDLYYSKARNVIMGYKNAGSILILSLTGEILLNRAISTDAIRVRFTESN